MASRPEEILDAAIAVLGGFGVRGLTHRAVDGKAGVPAGSTSNYFRTRDALLEGVAERFAARERTMWEATAREFTPETPEELATALTAFVRDATGPSRVTTLARYAIFVEAALRPYAQDQLAATAAGIREWGAQWLRDVGSADPERHCQILLDFLDGLMLHQLAFPDPDFDPLPRLATLIRSLVDPERRR